jgi:hypothetical protein
LDHHLEATYHDRKYRKAAPATSPRTSFRKNGQRGETPK